MPGAGSKAEESQDVPAYRSSRKAATAAAQTESESKLPRKKPLRKRTPSFAAVETNAG